MPILQEYSLKTSWYQINMGVSCNRAEGREGKGVGLVLCDLKEGVQGEEWEKVRKALQHIFYGGTHQGLYSNFPSSYEMPTDLFPGEETNEQGNSVEKDDNMKLLLSRRCGEFCK